MINLDTRLLDQVNENETWLLLHLAKRINTSEKLCWPSNKKICHDTGWNIDKVQRVKRSLMEKGLLEIVQRPDTSNVYKITTNKISIYVNIEDFQFEEVDTPTVKNGTPPIAFSGTPPTVKHSSKVLTNEVLTIEQVNDIVETFNEQRKKYGYLGKSKLTPGREKAIKARVKESQATIDEVKAMIEYKAKDFKGKSFGSTPSEKYFDLETLFRPAHFQKYLEQSQAQPQKDWTERRTESSSDPVPTLPGFTW